MSNARRMTLSSWMRWLTGLLLPGFVLAGLGLGALWLDYHTHWISRRIGVYLLQGNAERAPHGSVWQGILASRQTRSRIQETPADHSSATEPLPEAILRNAYWIEQRNDDFMVLQVRRRPHPFRPGELTARQMQDMANSLEVYHQGRQLLAYLSLPRDPFRSHALIRAIIALEDGSIFPMLHRVLRARDAPEAWDFIEMEAEESRYWHRQIGQLLVPLSEEEVAPQIPEVAAAVRTLVRDWEDSLLTVELERLQTAWEAGPLFQLRIVRNMDTFTGYAVTAGELPVRFELPALRTESIFGLFSGGEGPP